MRIKEYGGLKTLYYKYNIGELIIFTLVPTFVLKLVTLLKEKEFTISAEFLTWVSIVCIALIGYLAIKWIKVIIHVTLYVNATHYSEFYDTGKELVYNSSLGTTRVIKVQDYTLMEVNRRQSLFEIDDYNTGRTIHFIVNNEDKVHLGNILAKYTKKVAL